MLPCCYPFDSQMINFSTQASHASCEGKDLSKVDSSKSTEKGADLPHCVVYLKSFKIQLKNNPGYSEKRDLASILSIAFKLFEKEKIYCEIDHLQSSTFFYQENRTTPLQCLNFYPRSQSGSRSILVLFGEEQPSKQIALICKIRSTYQRVELIR